jgi:hypothetical protein
MYENLPERCRYLTHYEPATYRIRIQGTLDQSYSDYIGGLTLSLESAIGERPVSTLTGELLDQAALAGVLTLLYDLGLPLLSVEYLDEAAR